MCSYLIDNLQGKLENENMLGKQYEKDKNFR